MCQRQLKNVFSFVTSILKKKEKKRNDEKNKVKHREREREREGKSECAKVDCNSRVSRLRWFSNTKAIGILARGGESKVLLRPFERPSHGFPIITGDSLLRQRYTIRRRVMYGFLFFLSLFLFLPFSFPLFSYFFEWSGLCLPFCSPISPPPLLRFRNLLPATGCITLCSLAHKTRRKTEQIKSLKCAYLKRVARVI